MAKKITVVEAISISGVKRRGEYGITEARKGAKALSEQDHISTVRVWVKDEPTWSKYVKGYGWAVMCSTCLKRIKPVDEQHPARNCVC
jgi:hypothetical protein